MPSRRSSCPARPTGRSESHASSSSPPGRHGPPGREHTKNKAVREQIYSVYGPLSLLLLLLLWAIMLIFGFSFFFYALGSPFADIMGVQAARGIPVRTDLYVSGTTLFTLGLGDVVPHSLPARTLIIAESGVGLGFVALVIGYLPVLYQAFSRREVSIALLDARAGSPPTAGELLRRHSFEGGEEALTICSRSGSDGPPRSSSRTSPTRSSATTARSTTTRAGSRHSWPSSIPAHCSSRSSRERSRQAQLTFVMARHALVDLGHVFHLEKDGQAAAKRPETASRRGVRPALRVPRRSSTCGSAATRRPQSASHHPRPVRA